MSTKEELFNLYIRVEEKKQIILAVNSNDIAAIFEGVRANKEFVWIDGRKVFVAYDTFKIFDVRKASNRTEKSALKEETDKWSHLFSGVSLLKQLGVEVTDQFTLPIPNQNQTAEKMEIKSINSGKLFISHSSKDKELVKQFVDQILILGLGLKRENIFCTSLQGMGIKSGADFKNKIKQELLDSNAVIQIITKNYKESEVCLNEMGAAWVLAKTVLPLMASPFNYEVGFIHAGSQQLMLDSKDNLITLYDDHKDTLFTEKVTIANLNVQISSFLEFIENYKARLDAKTDCVFFYDEPAVIHGILKEGIFSHPFGNEDAPPETLSYHKYYYVELSKPIDVLSNALIIEDGDTNFSCLGIEKVQLHFKDENDAKNSKKYLGKQITVKGNFWGGHTGWHRTDVLVTVSEMK